MQAADAAALADANAAAFVAAADGDADAGDNPPALAAAINGLVAGLAGINIRLDALELRAEGAALGGANARAGSGNSGGSDAPPEGAGTHPGGGAAAGADAAPNPIGGDAGLARALATGNARALRETRRGRGSSSSDDDEDPPALSSAFTDQRARRCVQRAEPLVYFQLPPSARTSFPAPYRLETLRYRDDFPPSEPCTEADEARHLTIVGAWSSGIHNEILAFTKSAAYDNTQELQAMLLRSRAYHHQLAELCAAR